MIRREALTTRYRLLIWASAAVLGPLLGLAFTAVVRWKS